MTEAELNNFLLAEAVTKAVSEHNKNFQEVIARAKERGASSQIGRGRRLNEPWDAQGMDRRLFSQD